MGWSVGVGKTEIKGKREKRFNFSSIQDSGASIAVKIDFVRKRGVQRAGPLASTLFRCKEKSPQQSDA